MDSTRFFIAAFAVLLSLCVFSLIYLTTHPMQPKVTVCLEQPIHTSAETQKEYAQKI